MILVMLVSITTVVASDVDDSTTGANDNNLTVQNSVENTVVESENQEMINIGDMKVSQEIIFLVKKVITGIIMISNLLAQSQKILILFSK